MQQNIGFVLKLFKKTPILLISKSCETFITRFSQDSPLFFLINMVIIDYTEFASVCPAITHLNINPLIFKTFRFHCFIVIFLCNKCKNYSQYSIGDGNYQNTIVYNIPRICPAIGFLIIFRSP